MHAPPSTFVPLLVFIPLIVWRLYSRVRRSIGRQPLSKVRPWITVVVFPLLILLLGIAALEHPAFLWWLGGAVFLGALLGVYGLSKTRFENTPQGLFYTPNAHLGIALSLLLVARLVYRMIQIYATDSSTQPATIDFAHSPLTPALVGLLAGYYVAYAVGLIRWKRQQRAEFA